MLNLITIKFTKTIVPFIVMMLCLKGYDLLPTTHLEILQGSVMSAEMIIHFLTEEQGIKIINNFVGWSVIGKFALTKMDIEITSYCAY
jgi:hypothetical protein